MTIWIFSSALMVGLGIMLALEAWFRFRQRVRRQHAGWFGMLAMVCFMGAYLMWRPVAEPASSKPLSPLVPGTIEPDQEISSQLPAPVIHVSPADVEAPVDTAESPQPASSQPVRLQIPTLQVDEAIQPVLVRDGRWDVSKLGGQVGLLATTGQTPKDELAMVFAGHMTFPNANLLETGAFADLQYATYGTEIVVQTTAETLFYEVEEISRIPPDAVERLYLTDSNSILLITCTDWVEQDGIYANRLLIRAEAVPQGG